MEVKHMNSFVPIMRMFISKFKRTYELRKYDNFTIAEYFRKQGAQIGENCYIACRTLCTEPYLVKIGNHVLIGQGVVFHTHDGGTWIFREEMPDLKVFGPIVIEDNCIIGENVNLLPNITIGENSIVGAGSTVITDVRSNSIVMGVPARKIGSIDRYQQKCIERWNMQKPKNFHPDALKPFWEQSPYRQEILEQSEKHLKELFRDKLG
jgi:acetyltransferase-like isoleucine patch superfamily enzyme